MMEAILGLLLGALSVGALWLMGGRRPLTRPLIQEPEMSIVDRAEMAALRYENEQMALKLRLAEGKARAAWEQFLAARDQKFEKLLKDPRLLQQALRDYQKRHDSQGPVVDPSGDSGD